jgi:hypothetical protein
MMTRIRLPIYKHPVVTNCTNPAFPHSSSDATVKASCSCETKYFPERTCCGSYGISCMSSSQACNVLQITAFLRFQSFSCLPARHSRFLELHRLSSARPHPAALLQVRLRLCSRSALFPRPRPHHKAAIGCLLSARSDSQPCCRYCASRPPAIRSFPLLVDTMDGKDSLHKLVVLGDGGVGKTALIIQVRPLPQA